MHSNQNRDLEFKLSDFENIYKAAKEKDEKKLTAILKQGINIDIHDKKYGCNPLTKLAMEKDIQAVKFLIKFNAAKQWAFYGFAQAGHKKEVYQFLEETKKNKHYAYHLCVAAQGFGRSGDVTEAHHCLAPWSIEANNPLYLRGLICLAKGLSEGEEMVKTGEILKEIKNQFPKQISYALNKLAYHLTYYEYTFSFYVFLTMVRGQYYEHFKSVLKHSVRGYVYSRNEKNIFKFLTRIKTKYSSTNARYVSEQTAYFWASLGCKKEAYAFLDKMKAESFSSYVSIRNIISRMGLGFASSGLENEAYALLEQVKNNNYKGNLKLLLINIGFGFISEKYHLLISRYLVKLRIEYSEHMFDILKHIADDFSFYGNQKEAYACLEIIKKEGFVNSTEVLLNIAKNLQKNNKSIDKRICIKELLGMCDMPSRYEFALKLKPFITNYHPISLVGQASKFDALLKEQDITFAQREAWLCPEIQIFLLQGITLVKEKKLCVPILLHVATFLSPMPLPDMLDFANKFTMKTCPIRFFKNLKKQGLSGLKKEVLCETKRLR